MTPVTTPARSWLVLITVGAGLFCLAVAAIPLAEERGLGAGSLGRLALRPACHQIPERCLDLGAGPLPVCARCAGLYVGGFLGLLATTAGGRRLRPGWTLVAAAAVPSIVDFGLGLVGLPDLANWPRFWVATVPGLLVGLLVADAVCSIVDLNRRPTASDVDV